MKSLVVGGANSAGQAAVFLATDGETRSSARPLQPSFGEHVRYLIRRSEETPTIQVKPRTEIVALEGNRNLERCGGATLGLA